MTSSTPSIIHSRSRRNSENHPASRMYWTPQLHQKFVLAVQKLGDDEATPAKILRLMEAPGLTRYHVSSHLQQYRIKQQARLELLQRGLHLEEEYDTDEEGEEASEQRPGRSRLDEGPESPIMLSDQYYTLFDSIPSSTSSSTSPSPSPSPSASVTKSQSRQPLIPDEPAIPPTFAQPFVGTYSPFALAIPPPPTSLRFPFPVCPSARPPRESLDLCFEPIDFNSSEAREAFERLVAQLFRQQHTQLPEQPPTQQPQLPTTQPLQALQRRLHPVIKQESTTTTTTTTTNT